MTSPVVPMPSPEEQNKAATLTAPNTAMLAPILGMYAFAAATFIVAARMAHWYGTAHSAIVLFP